MPVPLSQMWTVASYLVGQKIRGAKRYPLVLMLEPLYRCNLSCAGCGKIQYPKRILKSQLSVDECMQAVEECGAPMVSIPGGEPLLHPEIGELVRELVARKKYIYLCTNAILLREKLDLFEPSKYLSFSVHLDGDRETHDAMVCRDGIYDKAVEAIREALARGFRVTTNTTLFDGADPDRTASFFDSVMDLGVEGMMVSPGYSYSKAPDQEHFLATDRTRDFFQRLLDRPNAKRWRFNQSPLFLEFLNGARDLECTPWSMPAFSVFGWQRPCYLLQEGYTESYAELLRETEWANYGHASGNPACRDCMVHSGFEASAVEEAFAGPKGIFDMLLALARGPRVQKPSSTRPDPVAKDIDRQETPTQGWSAAASDEATRAAFDYRGDVTLTLDDGHSLSGYVMDPGPGEIRLWMNESSEPTIVRTQEIRHIELSGRDPVIYVDDVGASEGRSR